MKKLSVSALALVAAFVAAPVMQAHADQTPGWYVGAGIGGNQNPDSNLGSNPGHSTLYYNPGWDVNGNAGYSWTNGLRLEGEVWHSRADLNSIHGTGTTSGHLSNTDAFANAYYDFHTGTMLTPYVGVGVGIADVDGNRLGQLPSGAYAGGNELELAYQGIAGVAAQLDNNWAVTADYRYVATTDPKFHTTNGNGRYGDNESHNIVLGVRYSFGEPAAAPVRAVSPPPKPMAQAAAKPVVAPVPQDYMVFFDFNKAVITPEAHQILASAAQDYKRGGVVKIVVTGHTDTVGGMKFNQKLSEHRAAAVKAELAKLGVDSQVIQAVGAGKNGLLVPTADGVREAQNRRAEITFDKQ
jgi:OOP family OmpA-OmpF porin